VAAGGGPRRSSGDHHVGGRWRTCGWLQFSDDLAVALRRARGGLWWLEAAPVECGVAATNQLI